jgi:hypothetical protein
MPEEDEDINRRYPHSPLDEKTQKHLDASISDLFVSQQGSVS